MQLFASARTTGLFVSLVVVGCVLIAVGSARPDRQTSVRGGDTEAPAIELRARFSNLAPGGQTTGFAVAPDGTLAVVDRSRQRVVRLTASGLPMAEWGPRFEADADAEDLGGIAVSGNNNDWYLLDRGRLRIYQLNSTGHAQRSIDLQSLGTYGPNGLALDARGNLYLADTGGDRLLVFDSGGALVRTVGTPGSALGQLKQPMGLSFGPDGAMYVADLENSRIERWDAAAHASNAWPLTGRSWGVAVDPLGRVFVPDADRRLVRMFDSRGDLLAEIGAHADSALSLDSPTQVGVAPDGSVLWVLGRDGLARIDLSPYSQIVPVADGGSPSFPLQPVGAALAALGLAPLALLRLRRVRPLAPTAHHASGSEIPAEFVPSSTPPRGRGVLADLPLARPPPPGTRASPRAMLQDGRSRLWLAGGIALTALGAFDVLYLQLSFADPTAKSDPWLRQAALVIGGIIWAAGCASSARALPLVWVTSWSHALSAATRPVHLTRSLLAGAGAVTLCAIAAGMWWFGRFETLNATRAMLVWLAGLVLAGLACTGLASRLPRNRPTLLALVPIVLFLLALAPRLWQAADLPYGLWYDEAQGAFEVRLVVLQGTYTPILNTYGKDTSGFFYLISGLSLFLGDGILAARSAAALIGALTVPATYLLGRELFGVRVGLAAGVMLAFMRWHINFSRLGFNPISLPLCATVAFWLLARAVRRKQWSDLAWAGLALGVGLHAYTGFRGMPVVAVVALALAALLHRWSPAVMAPRFGLYLGAAVLTALPVAIFALQDPVTFNGRTAQTLILASDASNAEKLRQIWDTVQRHALMFNVSGDLNGRHNLPGAPMLDGLTGGLVALGLGWLLIRPRDWRTLMLLGWSAASLSGGILTLAFEAPQAVRTFGITPVLAVLGGLGLVASLDRVVSVVTLPKAVHPWRARVAAGGLGAVALASIGYTNINTYFNVQMRDAAVFAAFSTRETVPAKAALEGAGQYSSILASTTMTPSVQGDFLVPNLQSTIRQFDPAGDLPYRGPGPGLIYLETEHDLALADEVARVYPDAIRQPVRAPSGGKPIVEGFRLDPQVISSHQGLRSTSGGDTAAWYGSLALDSSGDYGFRVPPGFELRIDDLPLPSATGTGVTVRLVRGNHAIHLSGVDIPGAFLGLEWRPPGGADWQPVPDRSLYQPPAGGMGLQLTLLSSDPNAQLREEYVDPVLSHYFHVSPFSRLHVGPEQWSGQWIGQLEAPSGGTYGFEVDFSQDAGVWIDNQLILGNLGGLVETHRTTVELTTGRHPIRVRFEKTAEGSPWINLYWTPPDSTLAIIPASALFPPPPRVLGPAQ